MMLGRLVSAMNRENLASNDIIVLYFGCKNTAVCVHTLRQRTSCPSAAAKVATWMEC